MKINCCYVYMKYNRVGLYTCRVAKASVLSPKTKVASFYGKHLPGKTNADVHGIWFDGATVHYVPHGIDEIFPNLTALGILSCGLVEISREDFIGLRNIQFLYIHDNKISYLPDDLFMGMVNLFEISIISNGQLKRLSSNLLTKIIGNELKYVDLSYNECVNAFYCPGYEGTLKSVQELIKAIDEACLKYQRYQLEKYNELRERAENFDLIIKVDELPYNLHREVLIMKSPVFAAIIKDDPEMHVIELHGFNPDTVSTFIDYLYTGEIHIQANFYEIFKLASRYEIEELLDICHHNIQKNLDAKNLLKFYQLAVEWNSTKLKNATLNHLKTLVPLEDVSNESIDSVEAVTELLEAYETYETISNEAKSELEQAENCFCLELAKILQIQ